MKTKYPNSAFANADAVPSGHRNATSAAIAVAAVSSSHALTIVFFTLGPSLRLSWVGAAATPGVEDAADA